MDPTRVAIVNDGELSPVGKIAAALEIAGFWEILRRTQLGRPADALRLVIKPEFSGYTADSPLATDPSLVEGLIDLLHDRGFAGLTVVGTTDSSGLWAENRDIYALSDLLGYSFVTPKGRAENGPYHSLPDWVRPHNMYSQGGTVSGMGRYHAADCGCAAHP